MSPEFYQRDRIFIALLSYGLMQSFGNMGPGDMLGLVSAELVPAVLYCLLYV